MKSLCFAILLLIAAQANAQAVRLWETDVGSARLHKSSESSAVRAVRMDIEQLGSLVSGDELELIIPQVGVVRMMLHHIQPNANASKSLFAKTADKRGALVLTYDHNSAYGYVEHSNRVYILEVSGSAGDIKPQSQHEIIDTVEQANLTNIDSQPPAKIAKASKLLTQGKTTNDVVDLDIMIVYTTAASNSASTDIVTKLNHYVASTNHFMRESGVNINVNLVHTEEVNYHENSEGANSLKDITRGVHPAFSEIKNLRYEYGADVVALMTTEGGGAANISCGWDGSIAGCASTRYFRSSILDSTGGTTFSHELGHAIGLAHSRSQNEVGYSFPFALGYRSARGDGLWVGTIMAYAGGIPRYSTPGVLADGSARTGVGREYQNSADASYALNAVRFQAADYYQRNPDLRLAADLIEQQGNGILASCVREGSGKYPAVITRLNCSGRGLQSLAGLDLLPKLEYLDLSENQIENIESFPDLSRLMELNLSSNGIDDITALLNLPSLEILHVSGNQISELPDFTPLEHAINTKSKLSIDFSENRITDIETLLEMLERKSVSIATNFSGNDSILCWQKQHLFSNHFLYDPRISNGQPPELGVFVPCDPRDDYLDFNANHTSNVGDLNNGDNPFRKTHSAAVAFSDALYPVREDAGVSRLTIKRIGENGGRDIEFFLATQARRLATDPADDDIPYQWALHGARSYYDFMPFNRKYTLAKSEEQLEINIDIIDDEFYYGDSQFQVLLYAVTGAELAGEPIATVTIIDDEVDKMAIKDETDGVAPPKEPEVDTEAEPPTSQVSSASGGGGSISALSLVLAVLWMFIIHGARLGRIVQLN